MKLEVVPAEALVVGPEDVLIIHISADDWPEASGDFDPMQDFQEHLKSVGLEDRCLVIFGEAELAKVSRSDSTAT